MPRLRHLLAAFALAFFAFCADASDVAVVAHEAGYYTSLANHVSRWLRGHSVDAPVSDASNLGRTLSGAKLAFLVGFNEPTAKEMRELSAFRARGGKLVVFYSASPALARLMGVKVVAYATAQYPGQWSRMEFVPGVGPMGTPSSILQTSTVLQRSIPAPGSNSRVMATWSDRSGRSTGDAAWIASDAGYWMTHVLLADGDEALKGQLLAAIVGRCVPGAWSYESFRAKELARRRSLVAYAKAQKPQKGEIRAVWDHSGCGLYPGDWPRTIRFLKAAKITDLFVNVAGAGFAHYPSDVLPRSKTYELEGDQLRACLDAAKGTGIRVHAWVLCFTATRATPARLEEFARRGWRLKSVDGRLTEYLDPSNPAVRDYLLRAVDEIQAKYRVGGVHLDFVRWYERSKRPKNAADVISRFVADARRHVRRPAWFTTAVLGRYPICIESVGQDWDSWIRSGTVDYVVPMDYTESNARFEEFLTQHSAIKAHARRTIAGIGVTANESRLDAKQVIDQINIARRHGLAGVALFDLDTTLEKQIIPYLRLGLW
ncbi:MAG: hypothetical protein E7049_05530 [Lentisphaerae bacterium]|nr:hypothetical protein [Lentisphaerota bacterium]